jgi:hypothetical protein
MGRLEEAEAEFHKAIALAPADAGPHNSLGRVLQEKGQLEAAAAEYRTALELGDKQAWHRLQACERMRLLRARLPGLIAGRDRPGDNAERLAFADLCRQPGERRYAMAASLYTDAFRTDPHLADDPRTANRFHAASAAAAAGCGQGEDADRLDENEKARLRSQALSWLRDELAFWSGRAQSDMAPVREAVGQVLRAWRRDAGLAGVRDSAALAKRTEAEREAWRKLWQEVEAVLAKAGAPKKKP